MNQVRYQRPNPRNKYCGVYCIASKTTGERYIGGSTDITGRYTHHRFTLRRGLHKSKSLQEIWNTHGETDFEFTTLENCEPGDLISREDWYLQNTHNINHSKSAITGYGNQPSEAKKEAARKRWANPEYKEKRLNWLNNRDHGRFMKNAGDFPQAAIDEN